MLDKNGYVPAVHYRSIEPAPSRLHAHQHDCLTAEHQCLLQNSLVDSDYQGFHVQSLEQVRQEEDSVSSLSHESDDECLQPVSVRYSKPPQHSEHSLNEHVQNPSATSSCPKCSLSDQTYHRQRSFPKRSTSQLAAIGSV